MSIDLVTLCQDDPLVVGEENILTGGAVASRLKKNFRALGMYPDTLRIRTHQEQSS